jgi:DNA transformation protein and related proteins
MSRDYGDYLIDMLAPWADVSARRMFGGLGIFRADLMFGIVIDDILYLKADDTNRPDYESAGSEPFTYEAKSKRVTLSYWQVPAEVLDDEHTLCEWAEKAYSVALTAAAAKKPPRPSRADPSRPVHRLHSLGPKSAAWLKEAGIETEGDLRAIGAVAAYRRLKLSNSKLVTLNMLWALHAALEGISWKAIDPETKARLKREAEHEATEVSPSSFKGAWPRRARRA